MERIRLVGGGVAGLHLTLCVQRHAVTTRRSAGRAPAEGRGVRLPSMPGHFGGTRAPAAAPGGNHRDAPGLLATHVIVSVGGPWPAG